MPSFVFLQKLFHPILRILGMSADLSITEEFPFRVSVQDWRHTLVNRYTSPDLVLGPKYRARMRGLQVVRMRRYKEQERPGHEYLVAEIAVPESGKRYLRFERFAKDLPEESSSAKKTISNGSSQSLLAISSNPAALDEVITIARWPRDSCIAKLDCENLPEPITLLDLALAAEVVHNDSDKYELTSRQCFWYADTISAVLETYFPKIKIQTQLRASEDGEDERHDENGGKFMRIVLHKRDQGAVDEIVKVFRQRKAMVDALVCFSDLYNVF